jgi:hypothetical protein
LLCKNFLFASILSANLRSNDRDFVADIQLVKPGVLVGKPEFVDARVFTDDVIDEGNKSRARHLL